ncbi:DUF1643 domain-containing protein [Bacillus sp. OK048]|uniref:DUF1643 domain-containing protein n=1 Tax=Bacillus sp. OK048 TaxID=1882761 RepID=UPI000884D156|nr:DUF1643 domain-containing protein [Bacillus sp. OK048]SDN62180.1 Protein of unknown function [Bacillus sp. OK048]
MSKKYPDYVKVPTECDPQPIPNTQYKVRYYLSAELDNNYKNKLLFILMNPSHASKTVSDETINYCAHIAFKDLKKIKIGSITIVNIHPYYEPKSSKLQTILDDLKNNHQIQYESTMKENKRTILQEIDNANYVFLCTGLVPKKIEDKACYRRLIRSIHDYLEENDKIVYLCKGEHNKKFFGTGNLSYHINPLGGKNINKAKRFHIRSTKFVEIPNEHEVALTHFLKG